MQNRERCRKLACKFSYHPLSFLVRAYRRKNLSMHRDYRDFEIYSRAEPAPGMLLGQVTQWYPMASIDYIRHDRSLVELNRVRLPSMAFDDQEITEWFGLRLAWIFIGGCYRELAVLRVRAENGRR